MLLSAEGLTKRFGGVDALVDVDFEVAAGEVVALVGDNGAGKSTLIKALSGAQPADEGTVRIDGERVTIRSPKDARRLGIATVYQDLALADNLDAPCSTSPIASSCCGSAGAWRRSSARTRRARRS